MFRRELAWDYFGCFGPEEEPVHGESAACIGGIYADLCYRRAGERRLGLVVCIACVKSKLPHRSRAGDMYTSPLFRLSLRYGRILNPEQILVLSAKYGVLGLSDEIEPYEQTLNRMPKLERRAWAERALGQLRQRADLENDRFVFLAGQRYRENLVTHIRHWEVPMEGLAFGEQLQWLKDRLET